MAGKFTDFNLMEDFNNNNIYTNMNAHTDNFDNSKKAQFKANKLEQAEREMYYDEIYSMNPGHFSTENIESCASGMFEYHKRPEPFDHNSFLTDQVVDDHTKKNHLNWVDEVTPWAGTASVVGLGEFSAGDYLPFQGLRRPRGVQQFDPWQITEVDEHQLLDNKPFVI